MTPELSLVIPIHNESPNIRPLYDELMQVLGASGRRFEVIVIDDGSTDDSFAQLAALQSEAKEGAARETTRLTATGVRKMS